MQSKCTRVAWIKAEVASEHNSSWHKKEVFYKEAQEIGAMQCKSNLAIWLSWQFPSVMYKHTFETRRYNIRIQEQSGWVTRS